jgi:trehalose 6-phosphate synthase
VADAIKRGLTMPQAERIERWEALMDGVQSEDVSAWRDAFVAALNTSQSPPCPAPGPANAPQRTPALTG